jgi:putative membrane protein
LDVSKITSLRLRLINEIPTLFLVSIVLLAVVKDFINFLKLFGGVLAFGVLLYVFTIQYKKHRDKQNV